MKNKILFLMGIVFILIGLLPINVLTVIADDGTINNYWLRNSSQFSIIWIHSVEKEEWEEFFVNKEGNIYLDSTRFKTFGAGVPNNAGKGSFIKDGWLYMVGIDRYIGELYLRAGSNTNHRLIINDDIYVLSKPNREASYLFKIEKSSVLKFLYKFVW